MYPPLHQLQISQDHRHGVDDGTHHECLQDTNPRETGTVEDESNEIDADPKERNEEGVVISHDTVQLQDVESDEGKGADDEENGGDELRNDPKDPKPSDRNEQRRSHWSDHSECLRMICDGVMMEVEQIESKKK
jgi:hypothetical protein